MKENTDNFDSLTSETQQRRIQVRRFIEQSCDLAKTLPPKKKLLFLMKFDSGFSNEEIAELCNCSVAKVNKKLKEIEKDINNRRNCMSAGRPGNEDGRTN